MDELEKLKRGIKAVADLISESYGVDGLLEAGELAHWDELLEGGRFQEWLIDFSEALKVLEAEE